MRLSATTLLALPLLAAAAESPFEQYKAQFQNFLGSFGAAPSKPEQPEAANADAPSSSAEEVKPAAVGVEPTPLTLNTWKDTLYGPVKADATTPEEWWVMVTGGNKTCFGHCLKAEAAFNEATPKLVSLPDGLHVGILNCDQQPVLCSSWSAAAGTLWIIEMLPPPAPIDIYRRRLNLTTTTADTFLDIHAKSRDSKTDLLRLHEGYFHPFDGPLAKYGLALPVGYALWVLNTIPSWAMMLGISFLSRTMMSRRMGNQDNNRRANAPAAAPRVAPPGDGRS